MKRALLCLIACLAFAVTSWAQSGGTSGSSDQATPHKHHHDHMGDGLKGCVEKTDSGYAIKHGGKDFPVTGSDDLSAHVGHKVKLAGSWAGADTSASAKAEHKTFNETGVTMISENCSDKMHKHKKSNPDSGGTTTPK